MDFSLLSMYSNSLSEYEIEKEKIYELLRKDLQLHRIEKGLFYKESRFPIQNQEKLEQLFPFSGILDIMGKYVDIKPHEILFLDLEAIGLSFQTSNFPFLVGMGYYQNNEFILKQYLLLDIACEIAHLEIIESVLDPFSYVASFNGKKFDIPLLKSRFLYYGKKWKEKFHHFDVYILWKRLLPKKFPGGYSQKNLENKILNFYRENDIDGSRVPEIFFDWQKYQQYKEMEKILLHNEWDVYNLFLLFMEALSLIQKPDSKISSEIQLSKIFFRNRHYQDAIQIIQNYNPNNTEEIQEKYRILYRCFYKIGDFNRCIDYLQKSIDAKKEPKEILTLIRILQHKIKDYKKAIHYIDLLMDVLQYFPEKPKNSYLQMESLRKRKQKLQSKL